MLISKKALGQPKAFQLKHPIQKYLITNTCYVFSVLFQIILQLSVCCMYKELMSIIRYFITLAFKNYVL